MKLSNLWFFFFSDVTDVISGTITAEAPAGQASATGTVSIMAVAESQASASRITTRRRHRPWRVVVPLPPARPQPITGVVVATAAPGAARALGTVVDPYAQARSEDEAMLLEAA